MGILHPSAPLAGSIEQDMDKLYPRLPAEDGVNFRLQKIGELQKQLETERDSRAQLYKRYRRGVNAHAADGIDTVLVIVSMGA